MSYIEKNTFLIKTKALQLGFSNCKIAKAELLCTDAHKLEAWLTKGYHADMKYMENHFDLRIDPRKLVPDAKTVISLSLNYNPAKSQKIHSPKIAKYAYGTDYHFVIKDKLNKLLAYISQNIGNINGRGFVDSAPVLERSWAVKSGIGWIGKNGNLIIKSAGSFFFLATIISDLELIIDDPFKTNHCGNCRKCIDACPTQAIVNPTEIDANKCISYLTIELKKEEIPQPFVSKIENWLFGCDICQDVCPWNRFSFPNNVPELSPFDEILNFSLEDWNAITNEKFNLIFKNSPLKRTNWIGIKRNLLALNSTSRLQD